MPEFLILIPLGLFAGLLAGVLGVGGGVVLVPTIKTLGYTPVQAVATSSLAIILTACSGSWRNWRQGNLDLRKVILLALPSILTAQLGAWLADYVAPQLLLVSFSIFLVVNIGLSQVKKQILKQNSDRSSNQSTFNPLTARIFTGSITGLLAGFFGIGGGIILVPLQILLLQEKIKTAIQTSLGVIVITSVSASIQHSIQGNVLFVQGLILGLGGIFGAQVSTRFLPKLPEKMINFGFNLMLGILAIYTMYQAINS